MNPPNDVSRCNGHVMKIDLFPGYGMCDAILIQCAHCLRRTATRPENVQMMQPPEFVIGGECPERMRGVC